MVENVRHEHSLMDVDIDCRMVVDNNLSLYMVEVVVELDSPLYDLFVDNLEGSCFSF